MQRSDHQSKQSFDDNPITDEGHVSDPEDTDNAHIPKVPVATWFKLIAEEERPATPEPEWTIPSIPMNDFPEPGINWANTYAATRTGKKKLCKADLEGPAFNLVKAFHKNSVFLQYQMDECHKLLTNKVDLSNPEGHQILRNIYEPLPLGGPPGDKERRIALSISKLKAARYLDFGLEELVPSLWVESEREYDISAVYGITHWWFRRKEFYINKHSEPSDREAVRSQMRILSVISVKVFEKYRYNYLREIILRRADYQEYKISEKDFKNLHPNDFEDLFLLNIQKKLTICQDRQTINLNVQLGCADYYFKRDYTIVPKPRAVVYRDRNDQRKLMRLNELHKFSDGTLTRVMEKLDHMVKDFHLFEYNKGMETRKWSEDDKRRSKDFITAIEKRLQIRRIYRSLESFVGGRIRDIDYRLINRTTRTVPKDRPCMLLNWSYKVGKVRSKSENKGKVPTEMELGLEFTQQGSSHELSVSTEGVEELKGIVKIKGVKKETLHTLSYERTHKGVKASANFDIMYFHTSAQDGDSLQDDVRLCLDDDLKKAQNHNQRQV
ncbi:hypothetical protein Tco_1265186 [Tanacetum coccineum]